MISEVMSAQIELFGPYDELIDIPNVHPTHRLI